MDIPKDFTFNEMFSKEIANFSRSTILEKNRDMLDYFQVLNSADIDPKVTSDVNFQYAIKVIILSLQIMGVFQDSNIELNKTIDEKSKHINELVVAFEKTIKDSMKYVKQTKKTIKSIRTELEELQKENTYLKNRLKSFENIK